jgi:Sec-independent protein secretion pathway component TatC
MSDDDRAEELDEGRMSVPEHLQELRKRLRNAGLVLVAAGIAASFWAERFFELRGALVALE